MDNTGNTELNYCFNCMEPLASGQTVCSVCGHDNSLRQNPESTLPEGTILAGKYLTGRILGQGGFGITYLGIDISQGVKVAVKEYFPVGIGIRSSKSNRVNSVPSKEKTESFRKGCDAFQAEAERLAAIDSPNVVKVYAYFRENETAYIVMNYLDGNSLTKETADCGGRIPWQRVVDLFRPLIPEIDKLHQAHMIHRDIKPDNIKIIKDGETERLVLLDFGAARSFASAEITGSYSAFVTQGYAPLEQYSPKSRQGPYTDVYALCATMYAVITGSRPPDAMDRLLGSVEIPSFSEKGVDVPENIAKAIFHGLAIRSEDRPQSMRELYDELNREAEKISEPVPAAKPVPAPAPQKAEKKEEEPKPAEKAEAKKKTGVLLPVLLAVLLAAGFFLYRGIRQTQPVTVSDQAAGTVISTQAAPERKTLSAADEQITQTAQAESTAQSAARETQSAAETTEAQQLRQTETALALTVTAEFQQTQTSSVLMTGTAQAEEDIRTKQTAQAESTEQSAARETQSAAETMEALQFRQTETARALSVTAEFQQTQTSSALMTGTAQAEEDIRAEQTAQAETQQVLNTEAALMNSVFASLKAGDIIAFGHYEQDNDLTNGPEAIEWQVLEAADGQALVISRYGLDAKPYNQKYLNVTWEACSLREWLNREFYDTAFSDAEKVQIRETSVEDPGSAASGQKGGNDTTDRIFLLSIDEAEKYFADDEARICSATAYAIKNGASVSGQNAGTAWWWLRSQGSLAKHAASVGNDGAINYSGRGVSLDHSSVRPAFRIDLNEGLFNSDVFAVAEPPVPTVTPSPTAVPQPAATPEAEYMVYSDTLLMDRPSRSAAVIRSLLHGTVFTYTGTGESREADGKTWIRIKTITGYEGWIDKAAGGSREFIENITAVGDIITMGHYEQDNDLNNGAEAIEWQVLAVEPDLWEGHSRALVISRYGLDTKKYNEKGSNITWETCSLRAWLNGEFYDIAFSSEEKEQIRQVTVKNPNNPVYGTKGGKDTTDRIFLLSIEEAGKYFANNEARQCRPTEYAKSQKAFVWEDGDGTVMWWLRSPGNAALRAAYINSAGSVYGYGSLTHKNDTVVRPAFWLDL